MKFPRLSPISGKINVMDLDVTKDQFVAWEKGALIQDAFPNLTPDEREFIKTGITPDDWDAMFGDGGEMYDP
tara:strand:- start:236 stop:451 length:216 start_codon:yes stop_codon:yes gene_type:complete